MSTVYHWRRIGCSAAAQHALPRSCTRRQMEAGTGVGVLATAITKHKAQQFRIHALRERYSQRVSYLLRFDTIAVDSEC